MEQKSGVLVKDLESKVSILERSNFDLKMTIYYLNEKIASANFGDNAAPGSAPSSVLGTVPSEKDLRVEHIVALQEANRTYSRRITELELELVQLKQTITIRSSSSGNAQNSSENSNAAVLDEGRKRERSAMLAIAEHDAQMILELEQAVRTLQTQHTDDTALVNSYAEKVADLARENKRKDEMLRLHSDTIVELREKNTALDARVQQQDLLLLQRSFEEKNAAETMTQQQIHVQQLLQGDELSDAQSSPSKRERGPLGAVAHSPVGAASHDMELESKSSSLMPRDFLDFGVQNAYSELNSLRLSNKALHDSIEKKNALIKTQEEALKHVKATVEDITMLEAEEIARLEAELEKTLDEVDSSKKKCRDLETASRISQAKVADLEGKIKELEKIQDEMITMISDNEESLARQNLTASSPFIGNPTPGLSRTGRGSPTNTGITSVGRTDSSSNHQQGISHADGELARVYRVREMELLNALEGVVRRVHQLESASKMKPQYSYRR